MVRPRVLVLALSAVAALVACGVPYGEELPSPAIDPTEIELVKDAGRKDAAPSPSPAADAAAPPDAATPLDAGKACARDNDCALAEVCTAARCVRGCRFDSDCPGEQICPPADDMQCVDRR